MKSLRELIADYFAKQHYTNLEKARGTVGEMLYLEQSDQILSLFESYIKSVKNPPCLIYSFNQGFESCRNELLKGIEKIEEMKK